MSEKFSDFDYPKWKYHASLKPCMVNSKAEEDALGPGWENSPAYFSNVKSDKKEKSIKDKMWRLLGI